MNWGWKNALIAAAAALAVVRFYACVALILFVTQVNVVGRSDQTRVAKVRADFAVITMASEMFHHDHRRWPASLEELLDPGPAPDGRTLEYLSGAPIDPWTNELYRFERTEAGILLVSLGQDRAPGGEGLAADIVVRP